jgi:tetratricopeptide (TPR) repeat protein
VRIGRYENLMEQQAADLDRLLYDVEWAIANGLPPRDLAPMLKKLLRHAAPTSTVALFAKLELARVIVEDQPWKALGFAREVLRHRDDDRAWAVAALAHTLLGNYKSAARAYRRALLLYPDCPWYCHNLGHLLDVVFDRPDDALPWLEAAWRAVPEESELASSYAHALARQGDLTRARTLLTGALDGDRDAADRLLERWLAPGRTRA